MSIWEKSFKLVDLGLDAGTGAESWGLGPLMQEVLASKDETLFHMTESGSVKQPASYYIDKMKEEGYRLIYKYLHVSYDSMLFVNDHSMLDMTYNRAGSTFSLKGYSKSEEELNVLREFVKATFHPPVRRGHIFAIINSGGRLSLSSIGSAGEKLVPGNYNSDIIEGYRGAIEDLQSSSPAGRIVVMEGEPGTGKTHLIKSFLVDVPDAMFVLVSPDMVQSLDGPELLPLLLSNKAVYSPNGPIVLVLEDADKCLVKRGGDNMNSIQALLNLSDGILGTLLDLRMIATTNAKKLEIEPAILRPGRLSKRIEVGPLDHSTALGVYQRLLPESRVPYELSKDMGKKMTLAEVYGLARANGWKPEERKVNEDIGDDDDDYDD